MYPHACSLRKQWFSPGAKQLTASWADQWSTPKLLRTTHHVVMASTSCDCPALKSLVVYQWIKKKKKSTLHSFCPPSRAPLFSFWPNTLPFCVKSWKVLQRLFPLPFPLRSRDDEMPKLTSCVYSSRLWIFNMRWRRETTVGAPITDQILPVEEPFLIFLSAGPLELLF